MTSDTTPPLTDDEIVDHFRAGTLLHVLQQSLHPGQGALHEQLAALHNTGRIDLIALPASPEFRDIGKPNFFNIQQIYYGVIPLLAARPSAMLSMVDCLITKGGTDGGAVIVRGALVRWIDRDPARAQEIILAAQSDPSVDCEVLRGALVTFGDLSVVRSFLAIADARRQAAIAALGGITFRNQQDSDGVLAELVSIASADPQADMRCTAIFAAFNLLQHCKAHAAQWVPRLVAGVAAEPSDATRTALLQGLWRHTELFQTKDARDALAVGSGGDLRSENLRGMLGATLYHLIGGNYHDLAIDCLTELLSTDGRSLPMESLQSVDYRLATLDQSRLFAIAVRWFGTGDQKLCEVVATLLSPLYNVQPFDSSLAGYGLSGSQMIVLCHKAIGYMVFAPVMAASFVIAALRANDDTVQPDLIQLLLETLLINFGATIVMYLERIVETDFAYPSVCKALELYRVYEKELNLDVTIKELWPSPYQRGVVRQKHYIEGRKIRKDADRQSVLSKLAHRSTVLYGRKVVSYARGSDQPPVSIEMKTIRSGIAMPILQAFDPVGLDLLMMIFRVSTSK